MTETVQPAPTQPASTDTLPIPEMKAPEPVDTDAIIRQLQDRINKLEEAEKARRLAAGIPSDPVEAALADLATHARSRAVANPTETGLADLAAKVEGALRDHKSGETVTMKMADLLGLDIEDLASLLHRTESTYLPELLRNIKRALLEKE